MWPCKLDDSDHYQADIDTSVERMTDSLMDDDRILKLLHEWPKGGCPLVKSYVENTEPSAFSSDTTSSLSDMDALFVTDNTVVAASRSVPSGVSLPQNCPICDVHMDSKTVLVYHLKHFHSSCQPYQCVKCQSCFNNRADLSCHNMNVHSGKKLKCKECSYCTVNKSRMQAHA